MRSFKVLLMSAGLIALSLGCAGTYAYESDGYYASAPPAAVVEYPGEAPYVDGVWIDGYYGWSGNGYIWHRGYWSHARPGYRWQPYRWEHANRGWHMRAGRWYRYR